MRDAPSGTAAVEVPPVQGAGQETPGAKMQEHQGGDTGHSCPLPLGLQ